MVLRCIALPEFDRVESVLVDVTSLKSFTSVPETQEDLLVHLTGLFCTRPRLRIAVVYADLSAATLLGTLTAIDSMASTAGHRMRGFADRRSAEDWLVSERD